ncbi:MAG: 16S rRNA (cytosine(1402)-N(4))-methyltransferase RsmH [Pirellula sp.]|nr:16S rRNA (cytosine(1402)-N(4))-methyltransferase RsmH [Pirellula sp.]
MNPATVHVPVLVEEVLSGLLGQAPHEPRSAPRVFVDGTLGGGGHARRLASILQPADTLLTFDRDPSVVDRLRPMLESELGVLATEFPMGWSLHSPNHCRWILAPHSYCTIPEVLTSLGIAAVDGILLDLGLSSDQLNESDRGFSFRTDGPLDLRFDPTTGISAADFLRIKSEKEIADTIYQYGEERFSRRIARAIVERRLSDPIVSSKQLADLIHRVVPGRVHGRVDSATRTFQALRIAVNRELEHVEHAMKHLPGCLAIGGRLVVISFHSLEDRIVKHAMREHSDLRVITKKPITASAQELDTNPRSRSAKLRIAERVAP